MSMPTYPSLDYQIGFQFSPMSKTNRVRIAANGRAYVQSLGNYDTYQTELLHPYLNAAQVEELRSHWDMNKDNVFSFTDAQGRTWDARYLGAPVEAHQVRGLYHVSVQLLLSRIDQ